MGPWAFIRGRLFCEWCGWAGLPSGSGLLLTPRWLPAPRRTPQQGEERGKVGSGDTGWGPRGGRACVGGGQSCREALS